MYFAYKFKYYAYLPYFFIRQVYRQVKLKLPLKYLTYPIYLFLVTESKHTTKVIDLIGLILVISEVKCFFDMLQ